MIYATDIKLLAPERLTDDADGGGRVTNNEVLDGVENNLFPDIASGDRITGRVWLRKIYGAVRTENNDRLMAARMALTDDSDDPSVTVALFTTHNWIDERSDAQDYVERYVVEGPLSEMKLLYNHVAGQRMLFVYQPVAASIPEIGNVYVLSAEAGSVVTAQQFVRVTKFEHEIVTYTDDVGQFQMRQITLTISDPLERTFEGGTPNRLSSYQPATKIRRTSAVDAASIKGISPLAESANPGDLSVKIGSIFTRIVPATQSETAVLDAQAGGASALEISGGTRTVIIPQVAHTDITRITIANRQLNYTNLLLPKPAPKTLSVSYRTQGKWYVIRDSAGDGSLTGEGAGIINYSTGSVAITLSAVPDVGSAILFAWSSGVHYQQRTAADVELYGWRYTTEHAWIRPGTLSITWESASVAKSATDDGDGNITGDATGRVNYQLGQIYLVPAVLPDPGSTPLVEYDYGAPQLETFTPTADGSGFVSVTATGAPIKPGSVLLEWETIRKRTSSEKSVT